MNEKRSANWRVKRLTALKSWSVGVLDLKRWWSSKTGIHATCTKIFFQDWNQLTKNKERMTPRWPSWAWSTISRCRTDIITKLRIWGTYNIAKEGIIVARCMWKTMTSYAGHDLLHFRNTWGDLSCLPYDWLFPNSVTLYNLTEKQGDGIFSRVSV